MPVIRPICPQDEADWRRLWTGYLTFYQTSVPEAVYAATFARLLSDDPAEFRGLVAEHEGRVVGLAHYLFHRHGWRQEKVVYLQDLYADPEMRGFGIGRALIEAVYAEAAKANAPKVYWVTDEGNATARQLYDRIAVKTAFIRYRRP